jgi:23S rRNA (adenine2503-C2)-methyltransferase
MAPSAELESLWQHQIFSREVRNAARVAGRWDTEVGLRAARGEVQRVLRSGAMATRPNLKDYSIERLRERLAADGLRPFRAEQIAAWLYRRGVEDPAAMTDLGEADREHLAATFELRALEVASVERSRDGTVKAALRARDGSLVESVLIPEDDRTTLCVSTQVGCPMACSFCATGFLGFTRNLTTAEIIDQVCRMRELCSEGREISNVVFMGMGEPLLNTDALIEAVRLLIHPKAFGMAPRRVTVSTVGVVPQIDRLLEQVPVNLAVSLHATTDAVRDQLVPLNRRYPLDVLLGALRGHPRVTTRRPVFFEYTLIGGVNDSLADARRLPGLLHGIPAKINLIPMNPHPDAPYDAPTAEAVDRFMREIASRQMTVTVRRARGEDIQAACGQLALRGAARAA